MSENKAKDWRQRLQYRTCDGPHCGRKIVFGVNRVTHFSSPLDPRTGLVCVAPEPAPMQPLEFWTLAHFLDAIQSITFKSGLTVTPEEMRLRPFIQHHTNCPDVKQFSGSSGTSK